MRGREICAAASAVMYLSSCTGLTQMQDTAAKFDQGVHAATSAEMSLFHNVQAAQCNRDFYRAGFDFATAERDRHTRRFPREQSDLDMRVGQCVHTELTDDQLALRQKLMDIITLYADSIQTLTNGTAQTSLSKEAQTVADDIKTLGVQQKFSAQGQATVSALNAAVVTIATLIIDHSAYKHVKDAAAKAQNGLVTIVEELEAENAADAIGLESKADGLASEMRSAVSAARDRFGPASFLDIVYARITLQSLVITPPDVAQMNAALDAVVAANAALARSANGGAIPEISDLITRAQQASTLFKSAK
jgi:hypothetical protein